MARQLSSSLVWLAFSPAGTSPILKKEAYSAVPPGASTKRLETTPLSSRPSKESAFLRERE